uniref:Uncharacterized protein n=1 Tax=Arundo donax TaxID=35708 RepID=A0A0A9BI80_ARUDO
MPLSHHPAPPSVQASRGVPPPNFCRGSLSMTTFFHINCRQPFNSDWYVFFLFQRADFSLLSLLFCIILYLMCAMVVSLSVIITSVCVIEYLFIFGPSFPGHELW